MRYPKTKKEHLDHKRLLSMLSNHFSEDEREIHEDEDEDRDDSDHGYSQGNEEFFERDGFGSPMNTFVQKGANAENYSDDYEEEDEDKADNDNGDYDDGDDTNDDADMDRPHKEDRKKMSIIMLGKKIGKNKAKKMQDM